ncbi:MAG: hypothetical protein WAT09_00565 [Paracoccaceae bacterium]
MPGPDYVKLYYMAADPAEADRRQGKILQGVECRDAGPFLDGPVHRRLAVVDLDPETGALRPGAQLQLPGRGRVMARYAIADPTNPDSAGFRPVSVFSTVWQAIRMFEEPDVLGRKLSWAFDGEQLLIVPEAGTMANAFYHRGSRSLQFFSFPIDGPGGVTRRAHTCLSPDIVAHEATHAILDGIAPDLYDASSPQSLALHEAIADLSAVVFAVRTRLLCQTVLDRTRGDLRKSEAFSGIAQELGGAGADDNAGHPLRNLKNDFTFVAGGPPPASRGPHDLSVVLSGAMYALFLHAYAQAQAKATARPDWNFETDDASHTASGSSVWLAAEILKRVAFRALDYLPPGEISFADYARAAMAADRASNPDNAWVRDFLAAEFVRRGIVASPAELDPVPHAVKLKKGLDLDLLVRSDWAAYQFAEKNRRALMIPDGIAFEVRPRLDATKTTFRGESGHGQTREVLVKVAWQIHELADPGLAGVTEIAVTRGTTLVIDRATGKAAVMLSTAGTHPSQGPGAAAMSAERAGFVAACVAAGILRPEQIQLQDGRLRLRGMGQMLHMAGGGL